MSDWKLAITWTVGILVGFYTVFVLMELWNWFAVPLLNVPQARYWLIYSVDMLVGLMTGTGDDQENHVKIVGLSTLSFDLGNQVSPETGFDAVITKQDGLSKLVETLKALMPEPPRE